MQPSDKFCSVNGKDMLTLIKIFIESLSSLPKFNDRYVFEL